MAFDIAKLIQKFLPLSLTFYFR